MKIEQKKLGIYTYWYIDGFCFSNFENASQYVAEKLLQKAKGKK